MFDAETVVAPSLSRNAQFNPKRSALAAKERKDHKTALNGKSAD